MSDLTPNHNPGAPLQPIDKEGLATHTEADGQFRNYTKVRGLDPVLVSEPPALLGDDSAPNPTEVAQAALAACISVGIQAIATHRGVTLTAIEIDIEGDIDISPTWGVGDLSDDKRPGVSDVRVKVKLEGDADRDTLDQIHRDAVKWSPVVNTYTRPARLTSELV